eukprot:1158788-Pelagomonas_calceolata.AAC.6
MTELEIELKELRSQRADMFEKYQVEKSEACQLNEIQDEIDRRHASFWVSPAATAKSICDDGAEAAAVGVLTALKLCTYVHGMQVRHPSVRLLRKIVCMHQMIEEGGRQLMNPGGNSEGRHVSTGVKCARESRRRLAEGCHVSTGVEYRRVCRLSDERLRTSKRQGALRMWPSSQTYANFYVHKRRSQCACRLTDEIENLEEAGDTQNVAKLTNARRGELVKKMRCAGACLGDLETSLLEQAKDGQEQLGWLPWGLSGKGKSLATQQASLARRGGPKGRSLLVSHGEVTEADVARVISTWTAQAKLVIHVSKFRYKTVETD